MSELRHQLVAAALTGLLANPERDVLDAHDYACDAVSYADAVLKQLEARKSKEAPEAITIPTGCRADLNLVLAEATNRLADYNRDATKYRALLDSIHRIQDSLPRS